MAAVFEKFVAEDLNVGFGAVTVTNPAGGTLAGKKVHMGSLLGPTVHTVTFATSLTIDPVNGLHQSVTLTADVTDSAITPSSGSLTGPTFLVFEIVQDSTGGRLFNWPINVLNGGTFPIDTTANYRNTFLLFFNGSNWIIFANAITTT